MISTRDRFDLLYKYELPVLVNKTVNLKFLVAPTSTVATPKGSAFVVGVSDNDLYFFIDGDRGVSKWSSFRKVCEIKNGFSEVHLNFIFYFIHATFKMLMY